MDGKHLANTDWRYEPERMVLKEKCLGILLNKFGGPLTEEGLPRYSTQDIYECAHDWVSQGHKRPDGIVKYFEAYYVPSTS